MSRYSRLPSEIFNKVFANSDFLKVFKPEYASSLSGTSSRLLDITKHLNGGGL